MNKFKEVWKSITRYTENLKVEGDKVYSYGTHVATIKGTQLIRHGYWSQTTSKHINYVAQELGLTVVDEAEAEREIPATKTQIKKAADWRTNSAMVPNLDIDESNYGSAVYKHPTQGYFEACVEGENLGKFSTVGAAVSACKKAEAKARKIYNDIGDIFI